ncbi:MAG: PRD domain-containing protein [Eubacteriales bacterium]|nr:PRD domain-containing protein [Eubacteriales bacterium]
MLCRKEVFDLQIIRKINTSAAIALDSAGREIVVLGKGIGFPAVPYELEDLGKIERTFYDVDPKYMDMIAELPKPILIASADITNQAEIDLNCELNPNLPFTLADHLNFAHERLKHGINLVTPIAYDIQNLYPREYAVRKMALTILQDQTGIILPEHEAVNVALHLINAEAESGDIHTLMMNMQIISEIDRIVEQEMQVKLDKNDYNYHRFVTHLRYLLLRLQSETQSEGEIYTESAVFYRDYPQNYHCASSIANYLKNTWGWECTDDEIVYLMTHIRRLSERTKS